MYTNGTRGILVYRHSSFMIWGGESGSLCMRPDHFRSCLRMHPVHFRSGVTSSQNLNVPAKIHKFSNYISNWGKSATTKRLVTFKVLFHPRVQIFGHDLGPCLPLWSSECLWILPYCLLWCLWCPIAFRTLLTVLRPIVSDPIRPIVTCTHF